MRAGLRQEDLDIKNLIFDNAVIIFLFVFVVAMGIWNQGFLSVNNLLNIMMELTTYGVVCLAMTVAIICGEFSLSPSSIFAWSSILFIDMVNKLGVPMALIITLACGALFGAVNGVLVAKAKINAFVVTLGMMIAVKGLALSYTNGNPINTFNEFVFNFGYGSIFGIPYLVLIFFLLLIIFAFILKKTRFGRNIYATGGDYEVAKLAGIKVDFYKFIVFVILGGVSALAGIMLCFRIGAGSAQYGADLSLTAVAAVVIGGTSLSGGNGGVLRTLAGVLVLAVLFNALTLLGIQAYYQQLIQGVILMSVVAFDALNRYKETA